MEWDGEVNGVGGLLERFNDVEEKLSSKLAEVRSRVQSCHDSEEDDFATLELLTVACLLAYQ